MRIKESIILDAVEIQPFSSVLYSIIGWNSKIGQWARIEGTPFLSTNHNASAAANICDLGGNVFTESTTDLMLP